MVCDREERWDLEQEESSARRADIRFCRRNLLHQMSLEIRSEDCGIYYTMYIPNAGMTS